jgi:hypothetical protein
MGLFHPPAKSKHYHIMSDDDEQLSLSGGAMAALQEFYKEQKEQEIVFAKLKALAEAKFEDAADAQSKPASVDMSLFQEDWQLSQFWVSFARVAPECSLISAI